MTTIRVEGLDEALKAFDRLGAAGKRQAHRAIARSVQKVRADAVKEIQRGVKSGRVYERGSGQNLSATHRASAPGEAPATDTGRLASSVKATSSGLGGTVGTDLPYGFFLEYGTMQMAERPWLRPALAANQQFIIDAFAEGLNKAAEEFNRS
jgi:HK97 gp10 family phage protein